MPQPMLMFFFLITSVLKSNMSLETKRAVNTEEQTPIASDTAKPWIEPVPS